MTKTTSPASIDAELDRIRAIRLAAEEELGRLRKELSERVATVEKKERELADAIAEVSRGGMAHVPEGADEALAHAQVGLAARAQELNRRENELALRERTLVREEAELARKTGAPTRRRGSPRSRSAWPRSRRPRRRSRGRRPSSQRRATTSHAARRRCSRRARDRAAGGAVSGDPRAGMNRAELAELDERLRRLEQQTREASTDRASATAC